MAASTCDFLREDYLSTMIHAVKQWMTAFLMIRLRSEWDRSDPNYGQVANPVHLAHLQQLEHHWAIVAPSWGEDAPDSGAGVFEYN